MTKILQKEAILIPKYMEIESSYSTPRAELLEQIFTLYTIFENEPSLNSIKWMLLSQSVFK